MGTTPTIPIDNHERQDGSSSRSPRRYSVCIQPRFPQEGYDQVVYLLETIQGWRHKVYHGKTGVIYNVTKSAVGVIIYKKVKHRYIEKRVNLRVEHISLSRSREEFVRRVKQNAELKKKSKTDGTHVHLKIQPLMPREARTISMKDNVPETVVPIAYETTI